MPGIAVVGDAGGITHSRNVGDAACVADDGYARHGVGESHDILGWAILLINTINDSWFYVMLTIPLSAFLFLRPQTGTSIQSGYPEPAWKYYFLAYLYDYKVVTKYYRGNWIKAPLRSMPRLKEDPVK